MFHGFMLAAHQEGLTAGEYAFLYIDLFGASLQSGSHFPDTLLPWNRGDANNDLAKEAYKVSMP